MNETNLIPNPDSGGYKIINKKKYENIDPSRNEIADAIDLNRNKLLEDKEITKYLKQQKILKDPKICEVDSKKIKDDFKAFLQKLSPPQIKAYRSYQEVIKKLNELESKYPDIAKVVKLGTTYEGRDILALKITKNAKADNADKPGIVFTGCHHAREWITVEVPIYLAEQMLSSYKNDPAMQKRIDSAEVWIVPLVNPDGYEYSRNEYSFWRKNRRPVKIDACDKPTNAIGTDLNRNYYDGNKNHEYLYRPPGDTPCSTSDDFGQTSDNPKSDIYRGSAGSSEPEIQALLNLELKRKNIKGVIDYHSYGNDILYPWGHKYDPVENKKEYLDIANGMNKAMQKPYKIMQSAELYPTSGSSEDCEHINGIISLTIEMARSFQPRPEEIIPISQNLLPANLYFIDRIIKKNSPNNNELRLELFQMVKEDQDIRNKLIKSKFSDPVLIAKMEEIDNKNRKRIKEIVDKYGWPGKNLVGEDGANSAWLLVQHADKDVEFQKLCLKLMKALPKGEVALKDIAYLTDRTLRNEGKKQIYGTQLVSKDGKWLPAPIEDELNVDKKRAEVGLSTLEEYIKEAEKLYSPPPGDIKKTS